MVSRRNGLSLIEQAGTIIIDAVLPEGLVDQMNSRCSKHLRIRPGDMISAVNGVGNIDSIIALCQRPGTFTFEVIRGPYEICPTAEPDFNDDFGAESHNSRMKLESEVEQNRDNEQLHQSLESLQEQTSQLLEDRRRLRECTGQQDLQKLLAERLAMGKRNFS